MARLNVGPQRPVAEPLILWNYFHFLDPAHVAAAAVGLHR